MNWASFDLNLLRVLDALLHEGSAVRAGDRIGLSQPAVSAALSRLRHALGDPLFVRQGGGLVRTDFARDLKLPLRRLLDEVVTLLDGPGPFDPAQSDTIFKILGADFFSEFLVPDLVRDIASSAPAMRLQLLDLVPENHAATLERYEVDLALVPEMELPDWIDQQPVFASSYVVVARVGHGAIAEAGVQPGGVLPLDLYCDLGHALFSPEGKLRSVGDGALARLGRAARRRDASVLRRRLRRRLAERASRPRPAPVRRANGWSAGTGDLPAADADRPGPALHDLAPTLHLEPRMASPTDRGDTSSTGGDAAEPVTCGRRRPGRVFRPRQRPRHETVSSTRARPRRRFRLREWHAPNAFCRDGDWVFRIYFVDTRRCADGAHGPTLAAAPAFALMR